MRLLKSIADWFMGAELVPVPVGLGRNEPCHCGSGLKYKRCCLGSDKETLSKQAACCITPT